MKTKNVPDVARQAATVLGVVFQIGGGALAGETVGRVSAENPTLVVPADYAFTVWGPIFALSLGYTVYQALPGQRQNPLLRRVGWFVAGAFAGNGLWQILFPAELFVASQVLFVGVAACAVAALVSLAWYHREYGLGRAERWLVALPVGLLAGWVTAAVFAGFATTLVGVGVLDGGVVEAALGSILLIAAAALASVVVRSSKRGPAQGYVTYGVTVVWALVAVVANQYGASGITTLAAALGIIPVALALVAPRCGREGPGAPRGPRRERRRGWRSSHDARLPAAGSTQLEWAGLPAARGPGGRTQRVARRVRVVAARTHRLLGAVPRRVGLPSTAPAVLRTGGGLPVAPAGEGGP